MLTADELASVSLAEVQLQFEYFLLVATSDCDDLDLFGCDVEVLQDDFGFVVEIQVWVWEESSDSVLDGFGESCDCERYYLERDGNENGDGDENEYEDECEVRDENEGEGVDGDG